jgi:FAD synthetase
MHMKKILVTGTFDILHPGHLHFLTQARKKGDVLIVVVARDKTVRTIKNRVPLHAEKQRAANLRRQHLADRVVLGHLGDKYKIIEQIKPDIICLGYDQWAFTQNLESELAQRGLHPSIIRLKAFKPHQYKSSLLRKNLIK